MQLLMRRPEVEGFISIAPPANLYDFSFLAPCPSSGLIVHGDKDAVVPPKDVNTLVEKLKTKRASSSTSRSSRRQPFLRRKAAALDGNRDRLSRHAARQRSLSLARSRTRCITKRCAAEPGPIYPLPYEQ